MFEYLPNITEYDKYNDYSILFETIIFIRFLKLLTLLQEIKTTRIIFDTLKNLIGPLMSIINMLGMLFYIFAVIGMFLFGGKIQKGMSIFTEDSSIPVNYHLLNFNDFFSAIVTLFTLMVVNNWMVQV